MRRCSPCSRLAQPSRKFKRDHVCAICDDCHGCPCWFRQKTLTIKLGRLGPEHGSEMIEGDCHEKDSPNSRPGLSVDHWHGTDQRICVWSSAAFDGPLLRRQGGHSAFRSHSPFSWAGEAAGVGPQELKRRISVWLAMSCPRRFPPP